VLEALIRDVVPTEIATRVRRDGAADDLHRAEHNRDRGELALDSATRPEVPK
jgi:hypothetical protein